MALLITASSTSSNHLPPDLTPTLITDCPLYHIPDPESPDGPCICDMDTCPSPDCPPTSTPISIISATSCCPAYQCVDCSDEDLATHKCHCSTMSNAHVLVDNSSYVDDEGQCACSGDEMTWDWYEGCHCDEAKCRLPDLCLGNSVEVRVLEGCCERIECVACPDDSIAQAQLADGLVEIEAKCVCRACPEKGCSENEVTVIRKHGKNIPNHCCDLYHCVERGCTINGTKYDEGEQWVIEKDAQKCRCQNGIALCNKLPKAQKENELKNCLYNGNSFRDGDEWTVDQCTNCTCHSGQSKCVAHYNCMQINESVVPHPSTCPPRYCERNCAHYETDAQGCHLCLCKDSHPPYNDDNVDRRGNETTNMVVTVVLIVVGCVGIVVITSTIFYLVRRKCKRMRYYPETKHNLLLDNNNTSRDIYTSTTKPDDQITLPLYRPTTIENTRN